jgi:hypothetical protein
MAHNNTKNITKSDIKRGATFLRRIHRLQSDMYYFQEYLTDKGHSIGAEKAGNSAFELDTCHTEMEGCVRYLQAANHGPQ